MTKQVIVVNKGLNMSKGKMAAQVSHASMAFLTKRYLLSNNDLTEEEDGSITLHINIDRDEYDWLTSSYTKVICEVKSEAELQKVIDKAIRNGLVENKDFYRVIDNGLTEFNYNKTWTCIGFRPMDSEKIDKVTKRLRLFKEEETELV